MSIERLLEIMAKLRDRDGGCPWDLEQSFETIAPYTIEEAYEVDDAIHREDWDGLRDELGDLLLQVVFHAQMAREAGHFDFADVVHAISDKLVRRHPHVFGDAVIESAEAQTHAWEQQKADERAARGENSAMDGVPLGLPALLRARKLVSRAARAGLEKPGAERIAEQLAAFESGETEVLGDLLFSIAALAQSAGLEPETALRDANAAFEARIRARER
jgi:nucleoside triphosphate diphosphatase